MRFGWCVGVSPVTDGGTINPEFEKGIDTLISLGYDFVELGVGSTYPEEDRSRFEVVLAKMQEYDIVPEVFNCFLPGDLRLTGESVNKKRINNYLRISLGRVKELGGSIVVFGSGGARRVDEAFSPSKAWEQLIEFLHMAADYAEANGITIAIEPLNRRECNMINTVKEACDLAKDVNRASIKVIADLYHMVMDNEPFDSLIEAGPLLRHIHVADTGRLYPGSGEYDYEGFFDALRQVEYSGRISVECSSKDFPKDAAQAWEFLRKQTDFHK